MVFAIRHFHLESLRNTLEREELVVVLLIEPATLENLQRKRSSSRQSECVDRELDVRVRFLSRFGLEYECGHCGSGENQYGR